MKVRLELTDGTEEDEVVIHCGRVDDRIKSICRYILGNSENGPKITFYKENREYYFPLENILFFETGGEHIYAHTADDAYLIKYRLYELEKILPRSFVRVSKSAVVNIQQIYSVTRNLASSSLIQFTGSHKQIYASRSYFRELQHRLQERSSHEM